MFDGGSSWSSWSNENRTLAYDIERALVHTYRAAWMVERCEETVNSTRKDN
jgi:hypothetical protein